MTYATAPGRDPHRLPAARRGSAAGPAGGPGQQPSLVGRGPRRLPPRAQHLTLDYRGTGDSDKPDTPHSTGTVRPGRHRRPRRTRHRPGRRLRHVHGRPRGPATRRPPPAPGRRPGPRLHLTRRPAQRRTRQRRPPRPGPRRSPAPRGSPAGADVRTPRWLADHPGPHHTLGDPGMPAHSRRHHLAASDRHNAWDLPARHQRTPPWSSTERATCSTPRPTPPCSPTASRCPAPPSSPEPGTPTSRECRTHAGPRAGLPHHRLAPAVEARQPPSAGGPA